MRKKNKTKSFFLYHLYYYLFQIHIPRMMFIDEIFQLLICVSTFHHPNYYLLLDFKGPYGKGNWAEFISNDFHDEKAYSTTH